MIVTNLKSRETPFYYKNEEEMMLTMECASKIMGHLDRHIEKHAKVKFINNRKILSNMIRSFQAALGNQPRLA